MQVAKYLQNKQEVQALISINALLHRNLVSKSKIMTYSLVSLESPTVDSSFIQWVNSVFGATIKTLRVKFE